MPRVYIGNLDSRVTEMELEDEFRAFGLIRDLWVARKPPGFAFIDFEDCRGVLDAVRELDGKNGWRVELSHESEGGDGSRARGRGGGGGHGRSGGGGGRGWSGGGGFDLNCYRCGECGHYARKCRNRGGSRRSRSRTPPRYRRSPSSGRSPRGRSPRRRSISPRRRGYSRSPPYRGREDVKHANGNGLRDRWRSRS